MKRRSVLFVLILALIGLILSGPSDAGEVVTEELKQWAKDAVKREADQTADYSQNTVAVLYFYNGTRRAELDPLQKGLAVMLITDLSQVEQIQVVERARLQALLDETNLGTTGLITAGTAPRVGRLLRAQYLVGGEFAETKQVDNIQIDSALLDVPDEKALGRPSSEGPLDELFKLEKELLFKFIEALRIALTPEQKERLSVPLSTNKKALLAFFKGIDSSDRGDYTSASEHYTEALKEDPNLAPARDALFELNAMGLISEVPPAKALPEKAAAQPPETQSLLRGLRSRVSQSNQLQPTQSAKRLRTPDEVIAISPGTTDVVVDWQ